MKALIITIVALLFVGVGLLLFLSVTEYSIYDDQEKIRYDEILDGENPTIYYYYQESCGFCNSIKDQISSYAQITNKTDNLDFKIIDMAADKNNAAWYDWETHNETYGENTDAKLNPDYKYDPADMSTVDDVKITGTPSIIYVEDGDIKEYGVGIEVFDVLDAVNEEYGIDFEFDRSKYGE